MRLFRNRLFYICLASVFVFAYMYYPIPGVRHLVWFVLVPFLMFVHKESVGLVVFGSWIFGAVYFAVGIFWLTEVTVPGYLALVLLLGLYWMLFGWLLKSAMVKRQFPLWLAAPVLWVFLDYTRSILFTGFPWLFPAHTQAGSPVLIQICEITGVHGLTFVIVMVNAAIADALIRGGRNKAKSGDPEWILSFRARQCVTACLALFVLAYGIVRLGQIEIVDGPMVAVVQGNIPWKIGPGATPEEDIWRVHQDLSKDSLKDKPELIIWPETMMPGVYNSKSNELGRRTIKGFIVECATPFLIGATTDVEKEREDEGRSYNSAYHFDAKGEVLARYDKLHLVPFGEYLPLRALKKFRPQYAGDFVPGAEPVLFHHETSGRRFGTLICFEDAFPGLSSNLSRLGADFLVTLTSDVWFGGSSELHQHAQLSIFRAVETRCGFVRAANTGISSFIGPDGIVREEISVDGRNIQVPGVLVRPIPLMRERVLTFYTRYGEWFPWFLVVAAIILQYLYIKKMLIKN